MIKSEKKYLLRFWILSLILTAITLIIPLIEGKLLNVLIYTKDINLFKNLILSLLFFLLIQIIIRYFINRTSTYRTSKFILDFNRQILDYIYHLDTKKVLLYNLTYLHSRLIQDTDNMIKFFYSSISAIINNIVILLFSTIILYQTNNSLSILVLLFLPIYIFIFYLFKEKIKIAYLNQSEAGNSCFSTRNNIYQNYLEIKIKAIIDSTMSWLKNKENTLIDSILKMFHLRFYLSTTQLIVSSIFRFSGFIIGGIAVMNGNLTMGVFTYLLQYFSMMLNTIEQFFDIATSYQEYRASKIRLYEVLNISKNIEGTQELSNIDKIELSGVNYSYTSEQGYLYHNDCNIKFETKNIYIINGQNGSGKTTILLLILGIYKDQNLLGNILFNNIPMYKLNMESLRKNNISVMTQYNFSFDGTVYEYILSILTENEYNEAINDLNYTNLFSNSLFNIKHIIENKYDNLSNGERQLLNLFVCLAKNTSVYLLDEPTSNIFVQLKSHIIVLLQKKAKEGKIVIVVTHDKELILNGIEYIIK